MIQLKYVRNSGQFKLQTRHNENHHEIIVQIQFRIEIDELNQLNIVKIRIS